MNMPQMIQVTAHRTCDSRPCGRVSTSTEYMPKNRRAAAASGHSACRSHRCRLVWVFMKRVSKRSEQKHPPVSCYDTAAKYRRCTARSLLDLENQSISKQPAVGLGDVSAGGQTGRGADLAACHVGVHVRKDVVAQRCSRDRTR